MQYGVKRGFRAPGEFGVGDIFGLGFAGAAGIISALVTDYQQSGEASALFTINQWVVMLGDLLGFSNIPLWVVIVGLTALGAGSIFYFQPITRQGAFAQGFGLLAVITTAVPADMAGGIEAVPNQLPGLAQRLEAEPARDAKVTSAAYRSTGEARLVQAQASRVADRYDLHLTINFPEGIPADVDTLIRRGSLRGRLHNEDTGETWNLFRSAGGDIRRDGNKLLIHAGVPARSSEARLWVRVECGEYEILIESKVARLGAPVTWTVDMKPSNTPLFIQRLNKSYWF